MLRELIVKNIVLIEEASLSLERGFTVISGETGAGKTALITALEWVLGERIDSQKIRDPQKKALVQAAFELEPHSPVIALLEEAGIAVETPLIIQREVLPGGKSRALISGQLAPLHLLQTLAPYLIALISQHSHQLLRSESAHLQLLDQFADIENTLKQFATCWAEEKAARAKLDDLKDQQRNAGEKLGRQKEQLEEIEKIALQEGEEEGLFEEYKKLIGVGEKQEKTEALIQLFSEGNHSLLAALKQAEKVLHQLALNESLLQLQQAQSLLCEILHSTTRFQTSLESDPHRLQAIDERLSAIDKLKKRYGKSLIEVRTYATQLKNSIASLETIDDKVEEAQETLTKLEKQTQSLAQHLSQARAKAASKLAADLSSSLHALNIPHAEVEIRLEKTARNNSGEDRSIFYLRANKGEKSIPVHESSSGGELARLFLALTVLLAEKNESSTMIFDEIDANVGGKTATLIGQQLQILGKVRQVLCITHFPQVADKADHHIRLLKCEENGRTVARIESLNARGKEEELVRMRG